MRVLIAEAQEHPTNHGHGGSRLLLSRALILLERLLEDAEPKARMSSVIEILILRALALHTLGDSTGALTVLGRALALAEPQGYIRLFLEEGAPMTVLLRQAYTQKIMPEYTAALLEASGEHGTMIPLLHTTQQSPLIEPLTRRERAVLGLLIDGASNREIAEHLVLSVNTVKKHVFNICSKLNVQSRAQVVARARTLNLL